MKRKIRSKYTVDVTPQDPRVDDVNQLLVPNLIRVFDARTPILEESLRLGENDTELMITFSVACITPLSKSLHEIRHYERRRLLLQKRIRSCAKSRLIRIEWPPPTPFSQLIITLRNYPPVSTSAPKSPTNPNAWSAWREALEMLR